MDIDCLHCSKTFSVCDSWASRGRQFCARECYRAHRETDAYFWSFVQRAGRNECWEWLGSKTAKGYGRIADDYAHRRSARIAGILVDISKLVCHRCDNPGCVNPRHLFQGTTQENTRDRVDKGRQPRGERAGGAKLTENEVRTIRSITGATQAEIAARFGVSGSLVSNIRSGRRWSHLL